MMNNDLQNPKPNTTMLSVMMSVLAIVITISILYALVASSSSLAQAVAFLLLLVAFMVFATIGLKWIMRNE